MPGTATPGTIVKHLAVHNVAGELHLAFRPHIEKMTEPGWVIGGYLDLEVVCSPAQSWCMSWNLEPAGSGKYSSVN